MRLTRTGSVALVAASMISSAGCTAGPGTSAETPAPLAELRQWGGMCPDGACGGTMTVADDGHWTFRPTSSAQVSDEGRLSVRQLSRLRGAVERTRLDVEPSNPPDGPPQCAADFDGRSVGYGWADAETGWTEVSSCEQHLDHGDPLAVVLGRLGHHLVP